VIAELIQDEEKLLKSMADRAAKPRDILLDMKQLNPHTYVTASDIRNQKIALAMEPKQRGRPVGSKDKQPCKKKAKKAALEEEGE